MKYSFFIPLPTIIGILFLLSSSCKDDSITSSDSSVSVIDVNETLFLSANTNTSVLKVTCTLSDGTETECLQITTNTTPTDHDMGPWCPSNISDDASLGGIWLENGEVYDVDGAFIQNMSTFYNDSNWHMYDSNGDIYVTKTEQDCINAANPNVGDEYANYCVECSASYIEDVSATFLIPITPVIQNSPAYFSTGPGGPGSSIPSTRGIALNGVEFSAPAPVNNILSAYTLAPFDDAGGHINVHQGYHFHAATGVSYSVPQDDGHAALIGYAMDGVGIYEQLNEDGNEPDDLDGCRSHEDAERGYHYHVDAPGSNNFISCLSGAYAN